MYSSILAITWNVEPAIFKIGNFEFRWYTLIFIIAFLSGFSIMKKIYTQDKKKLDSLFVHIILGTIIGARLGHCIFYSPSYYFSNPLDILKIWEGGLASHGGIIGIIVALTLYCKKHKEKLWHLFDHLCIPLALGGALVRLGNFFNSEIVGIPTTLPWAVLFEQRKDLYPLLPRHPAQIYEALGYFITLIILIILFKKGKTKMVGFISGISLILVFTVRILIELVKKRHAYFIEDLIFSMGQILSIPFFILGIYLIISAIKKEKNP